MKAPLLMLLALAACLLGGCGSGGQTSGDASPEGATAKPGEAIGVPEGEK